MSAYDDQLRTELEAELASRMPLDAPFTTTDALAAGISFRMLQRCHSYGVLSRPLRGVYQHVSLADSLEVRAAALRLVVPEGAVVTDRTAGWLHGVPMILAPGDHQRVPRLNVFCPPGNRLRNTLTASGERRLSSREVMEVEGLRVTTPLRTACDLGRLLHVDQGLAALDAFLRSELVTASQLATELHRFKGYRGVVQLRQLVPLADGRAESPGESVLRRRWLGCGIPAPVLQYRVPAPHHGSYYLDLALPGCKFGAEYDGAEFHDVEQRMHDKARRAWIRTTLGWILVVVRAEHVFGPHQAVYAMLTRAHHEARRRCAA